MVVESIVRELDDHAPQARIVIATNPVDVLTRVAIEVSKRPAHRIFGTGTTLDSARLRALLGDAHAVSPKAVHAHVLGEHGDSQVVFWSGANVGGVLLGELEAGPTFDDAFRKRIEDDVRGAASAIIAGKGYTNLAIGVVIASLVDTMFRDQRSVHPLSVGLAGEFGVSGVAASVPCILGDDGIVGRVVPRASEAEVSAFRRSADLLETAFRTIKR